MNINIKHGEDNVQVNVEELMVMDVNKLPELMTQLPTIITQMGVHLANAKLDKNNAANDVKVKKATTAKFFKEVVAPRDGLKVTVSATDEFVATHVDVIAARDNREASAHRADCLTAIVAGLNAKLDIAKLVYKGLN